MLSRFSVKRPFTVLVCMILIIILGAVSFVNMTPDLLPDMDFPYMVIVTVYAGATPQQVELVVTQPLEAAVAGIDNLKSMQSVSASNYSMIILEFSDEANMDTVTLDINAQINLVEGYWDERVAAPYMLKINPNILPVSVAAVDMEGMSTEELSAFVTEKILGELKGVQGVAGVSATGMIDSQINVVITQSRIDEINDRINSAISGKLNSALRQLNDGKTQLTEAESTLSGQKAQLTATLANVESALTYLNYAASRIPVLTADIETRITDAMNTMSLSRESAVTYLSANDSEYAQHAAELAGIDANLSAMGTDRASVSSKIAELNATKATIEAGISDIDNGISMTQAQLSAVNDTIKTVKKTSSSAANVDVADFLTVDIITSLLSAQNFSMPAGYVGEGNDKYMVRVGDEIADLEELQNLVLIDLGISGVEPIRLKDVAEVSVVNNADEVYAKINGRDGVVLSFSKQSLYATATVSDNINKAFEELSAEYEGLTFTSLMDQGMYIDVVVSSVLNNLLIGAVLAVLILIYFLRDVRPTFVVALSIPISVTFAIALMYFSNVTLNIISLAGLAVGVGMLVDNSIVVIENIYRLRKSGLSPVKAAVSGASQVAGAITSSTLTTVCVFVPIVFVDGITKQLFVDMALTVAYSLLASLFIALTLVPAVSSGLLKKTSGKENESVKKLSAFYEKALKAVMAKKALTLALACILLVSSVALTLAKGFEFMPDMDTTQLMVSITLPEDAELAQTAAVSDTASERIMGIEGVETVGVMLSGGMGSIIGFSSSASEAVNECTMYVIIGDSYSSQSKKIEQSIYEVCEDLECKITVSGSSSFGSAMDAVSGSGITIYVYGDDIGALKTAAETTAKALECVEGCINVSDGIDKTSDEIKITVDKAKAVKHGLTVAQVYLAFTDAIGSETSATEITYNSVSYEVVVSSELIDRADVNDIKNFKISYTAADGSSKTVKLGDVAEITVEKSLTSISRSEQRRYLTVSASLDEGYNVTLVNEAAKQALAGIELPEGCSIEFAGENETIMSSLKDLALMLLLGIVIVYLIMVAQFQSLLSPFIVLFTIPLAFTGGMLALLVCGFNVSVISMIGFIMLVGIIVNNGIVLVDCINNLRSEGMEKNEAVFTGSLMRLRPVLMTALTTILGLVPLAFGWGLGADLVQPVAVVCIGGLIYATLMTLFIIPVMYDILVKKPVRTVTEEELEISEL